MKKQDGVYQMKIVTVTSGFRERPPLVIELEQQHAPRSSESNKSSRTTQDNGDLVDLMVVYTAGAASRAGGANLLEQALSLAVDEVNIGLADSGIDLEIDLVHSQLITYQETNNTQVDFDRLQATSDGFMDEVHGYRDQHRADLVMLVIGDGDFFCGRAGWGYSGSRQNLLPEYGFSILAEYCIQTTVFAHELGHNFGAQHDRFINNSGGVFEYSHGFTAPSESWHTIMAYPDGCNYNCVGINRWSNPSQSYNGETLGVPIGATDAADNATTLTMTKASVAGFRQSASSVETCNGQSVTVDIGAGDVPTAGDDVILGTSGNDVIRALAGNDTVCGMEGDDDIFGANGSDWIDAGPGADFVTGGADDDTIRGGSGNDRLVGNGGDDNIDGENGNDVIFGSAGDDVLMGSEGSDRLNGDNGEDTLLGGDGFDILKGNGGNDMLFGGGGIDNMSGGSGDDFLSGGLANDIMGGNSGADVLMGDQQNDQMYGGPGEPDECSGGVGGSDFAGVDCEIVTGVP
ncbi:M12 family metallo-peptidase [Granulosicoccus sp. 3-233]|uniref:M12 family metallo-peptidase n=1 Tax=Granulosicoccus sp. 3-233 TaxID=3417969 RepID=UPI003D357263